MGYRTLATIEADIRYRYDIESFTARHPQVNIFTLINDAMRELRERLASDGSTVFTACSEGLQSVTGRTTNYPGTKLTSSVGSWTAVDQVHLLDGTLWCALQHISLSDAIARDDQSEVGIPQYWCLAGLSAEAGPAITAQGVNIVVLPSLDSARTFRVVGLQSWTDLTSGTDRIATDLGFHEYVVAYVGDAISVRDDDVKLAARRRDEKEQVYQELKRRCLRRDNGPVQRSDARPRYVRW